MPYFTHLKQRVKLWCYIFLYLKGFRNRTEVKLEAAHFLYLKATLLLSDAVRSCIIANYFAALEEV
jgi:hypothetical protein